MHSVAASNGRLLIWSNVIFYINSRHPNLTVDYIFAVPFYIIFLSAFLLLQDLLACWHGVAMFFKFIIIDCDSDGDFFKFGNKKILHGVKSAEYGGRDTNSHTNSPNLTMATASIAPTDFSNQKANHQSILLFLYFFSNPATATPSGREAKCFKDRPRKYRNSFQF